MSEINLKRINRSKYCPDCKEVVSIKMEGLIGRCPNPKCNRILYNIDNRNKETKKDGKR